MEPHAALVLFGSITLAGVALVILGTWLRETARRRGQKGTAIMKRTNDGEMSFDTVLGEYSDLKRSIPDLPALFRTPIEYDGWIDEAFKRARMRSVGRTMDEQIKLNERVLRLGQQQLAMMKNQYEKIETALSFELLKDKADKNKEELQLERYKVVAEMKEIDIRLKELDLRDAELDQKIKAAREGKRQGGEQTAEERFRARFKPAIDCHTVRQIEKEEVAKYPDDPDTQAMIHRIADDICERLMEQKG